MNSLISVNYRFYEVSPRDLVQLIINSKYTKGIELYVDYLSSTEMKYLDDIVFEVKKYNLILQIHANYRLSLEDQIKYFKVLEKYSDYLGYPIVVTIHPLYDDNKEVSLKITSEYLNSLIDSVDNNKIILCLENLNDIEGNDRLEKEYSTPIVLNNELLFFTYDIGHELIDYGNVTNLNNYMIEEIRNVHIHSNNGMGRDHFPIYKNDMHWNEIIKALTYLINNKYKYNIVYEYEITLCRGNTLEEKIKDYLDSIDFVTEHYI